MPVIKPVWVGAIAATLALFQADTAQAITLADPEITQLVIPDEPYGAHFWNSTTAPFTAVSALNGSWGSVSTVLGQSPTIAGEVTTGTTGYVSASNKLTYQLAYLNPTGTHDLLNVSVQTFDTLLAQGSKPSLGYFYSYAWSQLSLVGPASDVLYTGYHCASNASFAGYQPCGGGANAPITSFTVNLQQNTVYSVTMQIHAEAKAYSNDATAIGMASALLDPTFTVNGTAPIGGSFIFSAGVAPVPEPESWAMLMAGLACVMGAVRRQKRAAST
jgi:hypothetical protein